MKSDEEKLQYYDDKLKRNNNAVDNLKKILYLNKINSGYFYELNYLMKYYYAEDYTKIFHDSLDQALSDICDRIENEGDKYLKLAAIQIITKNAEDTDKMDLCEIAKEAIDAYPLLKVKSELNALLVTRMSEDEINAAHLYELMYLIKHYYGEYKSLISGPHKELSQICDRIENEGDKYLKLAAIQIINTCKTVVNQDGRIAKIVIDAYKLKGKNNDPNNSGDKNNNTQLNNDEQMYKLKSDTKFIKDILLNNKYSWTNGEKLLDVGIKASLVTSFVNSITKDDLDDLLDNELMYYCDNDNNKLEADDFIKDILLDDDYRWTNGTELLDVVIKHFLVTSFLDNISTVEQQRLVNDGLIEANDLNNIQVNMYKLKSDAKFIKDILLNNKYSWTNGTELLDVGIKASLVTSFVNSITKDDLDDLLDNELLVDRCDEDNDNLRTDDFIDNIVLADGITFIDEILLYDEYRWTNGTELLDVGIKASLVTSFLDNISTVEQQRLVNDGLIEVVGDQ